MKTFARLAVCVRLTGVRILLFILAVALAGQAGADNIRPIRLMTRDDLELAGVYYPVATNSAAAVLLIHSYGKNHEEWGPVAPLFQENGIAVLAIDLRGHGDSTRRLTADGVKTLDYHNFSPQDFTAMLLDINQAYDWLSTQPGIDAKRIAVVGSSIGANLALRYAAFNDEVAGLILISPGLVYHDLRTDDVITKYGRRPLRIVVSRDDVFAFESSRRLIDLRQHAGQAVESNELIACSGTLHGSTMLTGVKGLSAVVFGWLEDTLSVTPTEPLPGQILPAPSTNQPPSAKSVESNQHR